MNDHTCLPDPEAAAHARFEELDHSFPSAVNLADHKSSPGVDDSDSGMPSGVRGGLPVSDHVGQGSQFLCLIVL